MLVPPPLFAMEAVPESSEQPVQQSLFGDPQPVRVPAELWELWLADEQVRARYEAKV